MPTPQVTQDGRPFASIQLHRSNQGRVATWAFLFEERGLTNELALKLRIGSYAIRNNRTDLQSLHSTAPRSQIVLPSDQLASFLDFLTDSLPALKSRFKCYVPVADEGQASQIERFKALLNDSDRSTVIGMLESGQLLPDDLVAIVCDRERRRAVQEFQSMLGQDLPERRWQSWFTQNDWVLGHGFVSVLDERTIDPENVSDYLVEAADGCLDLIEIKRPSLRFWAESLDHDNLVPHGDLIRAITQCHNYLYELEREMNSTKASERYKGVPIAKPRALLIHGRSEGWGAEHFRAQRLLNGGLSCVQVITYDQVLEKARRILAKENEA